MCKLVVIDRLYGSSVPSSRAGYLENLLDVNLSRKSKSCDSDNILNLFNQIDKSDVKEGNIIRQINESDVKGGNIIPSMQLFLLFIPFLTISLLGRGNIVTKEASDWLFNDPNIHF